MENDIHIPGDVPYGSFRSLIRFAGDQKIDFYGEGMHEDDNEPEYLFKIADTVEIGVLATQLGLISMCGGDFPEVPYLVKLNSKTNLVKSAQKDPPGIKLKEV